MLCGPKIITLLCFILCECLLVFNIKLALEFASTTAVKYASKEGTSQVIKQSSTVVATQLAKVPVKAVATGAGTAAGVVIEGGFFIYDTHKNYKKYKNDEITETQLVGRTVASGVSGACTVAGTTIGGVVGTVFGPGPGTVVGGIAGGVAGKVVGFMTGRVIKLFTE